MKVGRVTLSSLGLEYSGFPLPNEKPLELSQRIDCLSRELAELAPDHCVGQSLPTTEALDEAHTAAALIRGKLIALQEELDWQCYEVYGLVSNGVTHAGNSLPELELGQRAFEIVMARQMAAGELDTTWFERHGSTPSTEIPTHWPIEYRQLIERRIELIDINKEIGLIEKPEYKRRWNTESWEEQQQRALRRWLLDRLEGKQYWPDPKQNEARLQSVAELSDKASGDQEFMQVASILRRRDDFDVAALVTELVESESVPYLPNFRYKPAGLRKREVWEKTWELQRKEEAGENVGDIKVPPKYTTGDFQKTDYWRLRGKFDVPIERWISFPHCETEGDPSLVVGWAGWNHLQQGTAIVAYYDARKNEGWTAERLTPLLAGLDQLLPWIHQWHPEIDPEYNETAGTSFQTLLESEAQELGLTLEQIRSWTPPAKKKATKKKAAKKPHTKATIAEATEGE